MCLPPGVEASTGLQTSLFLCVSNGRMQGELDRPGEYRILGGKPSWSEENLAKLLATLGHPGHGWLPSEGVRLQFERMAVAGRVLPASDPREDVQIHRPFRVLMDSRTRPTRQGWERSSDLYLSTPRSMGKPMGEQNSSGTRDVTHDGRTPLRLALFSDVHGRLRLVLHLLRCWQIAHRMRLDGALIAGDLGCFPDPARFDRATRRWVEKDAEEAGFAKYFTGRNAAVDAFLDETEGRGPFSAVFCPIFFVPGNHEDYDYLESCASRKAGDGAPQGTFPVDAYGRVNCLRDGEVVVLGGAGRPALCVGGIWGIEKTSEFNQFRIREVSVARLGQLGPGSFDLLLTHDVPIGPYPYGSLQVTKVLQACKPKFHLFGHVKPKGRYRHRISGTPTESWVLRGVEFGSDCTGDIKDAMAILTWSGESGKIELVEERWLRVMRHATWSETWPGPRHGASA